MKSPLIVWAQEVLKHMRENGEEVTASTLAAHMVVQDAVEIQDFYFAGIPPQDRSKLNSIINRIETIRYVAKRVVVN